jgi:hypothetical protein
MYSCPHRKAGAQTMYLQFVLREVSCFCCGVVEAFALLGCYAAYVGSCLLTFGTVYLEDGINRWSQNVGKELPTHAQ